MNPNQNSRPNNRPGRQNNKPHNRGRNQNVRGGRKGTPNNQSRQPLTSSKQVDSYGPAGKIRGNVKQLYDRYLALAYENRTRDRTESEAYGQYAHHYFSLHSEFAEAEAAQQAVRANEKQKKQQEEAEKQSNVVPIADEESKPLKNNNSSKEKGGETITIEEVISQPKLNLKNTENNTSPEHNLKLSEEAAKQKPKRARKPRKIKEEVAE